MLTIKYSFYKRIRFYSILHSIVNQKDNRMAAKVMGKMAVGNGLLNAGLVSRAHSKHNISSWSKKKKIVS